MALIDHFLPILIPAAILLHLLLAPYSKVEESFNLQAVHDIIRYGIPDPRSPDAEALFKAEYDHFSFPGVVPRTFVGALVLAGLSKPFITLMEGMVNEQVIVRGVLGLLNALALMSYARAARGAFGQGVANWYILLQATQFHVIFYASRTLPNMFAFALTTIALQQFLLHPTQSIHSYHRSQCLGIYLLTITGIIFRSEIALLLITQILSLLIQRRTSILRVIIPAGLCGAAVGLALTLTIDSCFWQSYSTKITPPIFTTPILTRILGLVWPEYSAFHFNAIEGSASQWGTSPWYTYFTSSIPKLLMNPFALLFLLPIALSRPALSRPAAALLLPVLSFVAGYSYLAHKEWRFIVYVVPHITLSAALGANWIWVRRGKAPVMAFLLVTSVIATFAVSTAMLLISSANYPGGEALSRLHTLLPQYPNTHRGPVTVHLDVPVCMTGATRFLQDEPLYPVPSSGKKEREKEWFETSSSSTSSPQIRFDKTENPTTLLTPSFWDSIDWVLSSSGPARVIGKWEVVDVVRGLKQVKVYRPGEETGLRGGEVCMGPGWKNAVAKLWGMLEKIGRPILKGRWLGVEMEDTVWILKKVPEERGEELGKVLV